MKFAAAYLLACLGAEQAAAASASASDTEEGAAAAALPAPAAPTKDDVRRILGSVGAEVDEDRLDLLFALMGGKDVADLIAAGREQLAYAPSGAASASGAAAAPAAAAGAAAEAKEDEAKKKEEEVEEEDDDALFNLFD